MSITTNSARAGHGHVVPTVAAILTSGSMLGTCLLVDNHLEIALMALVTRRLALLLETALPYLPVLWRQRLRARIIDQMLHRHLETEDLLKLLEVLNQAAEDSSRPETSPRGS